jgi:membrane fusion protein, copper/silver efflux system
MSLRFFTITKIIKNLTPKSFMKTLFYPEKNRSWTLILWLALLLALPFQVDAKTVKPPDVDYYTCTMHPSVRSQDPDGKCPICGMDLVPVLKKGAPAMASATGNTNQAAPGERKIKFYQSTMSPRETSPTPAKDSMGMEMEPVYEETGDAEKQPDEFTVPVERQQQIGVTYATIGKQPFHYSVRTVGTVAFDKARHWDYVARVEGYVSKLSVFSRGDLVEKDSPLMSIYSPDLLTTENEFINLLKTQDDAHAKKQPALLASTDLLVDGAKQRLRLWNITDEQIENLENTRQPKETLTLYSPFKGVVQDIDVDQGRHVSVGDHLVDVADLSAVWVWGQFYQDDLSLLKTGSSVTITTSSYPGDKFAGKISVIDPFLNNETRTVRARIDVDNSDFKLRPDMYVDVELDVDMGEGVAVPVAAVLPTGLHNIVFVDKGNGRLQPRFVELGRKYGDFFEVKSGLNEGERVVNSANFLIDAEAQVQGALKSW